MENLEFQIHPTCMFLGCGRKAKTKKAKNEIDYSILKVKIQSTHLILKTEKYPIHAADMETIKQRSQVAAFPQPLQGRWRNSANWLLVCL